VAIQDESERPPRSDSKQNKILVLILLIAGIFAPYGIAFGPVSTLLFPLVWLYWPPVIIRSGLFFAYSLMYGLPGYIQYFLFLYTLIGRVLYPYQLRRYLHEKSTLGATLLIGLAIELPLISSVFLAFPVMPLPICTIIAYILMKYYDGSRNRVS
jgi:uncharacterized Tic20 family protein